MFEKHYTKALVCSNSFKYEIETGQPVPGQSSQITIAASLSFNEALMSGIYSELHKRFERTCKFVLVIWKIVGHSVAESYLALALIMVLH